MCVRPSVCLRECVRVDVCVIMMPVCSPTQSASPLPAEDRRPLALDTAAFLATRRASTSAERLVCRDRRQLMRAESAAVRPHCSRRSRGSRRNPRQHLRRRIFLLLRLALRGRGDRCGCVCRRLHRSLSRSLSLCHGLRPCCPRAPSAAPLHRLHLLASRACRGSYRDLDGGAGLHPPRCDLQVSRWSAVR